MLNFNFHSSASCQKIAPLFEWLSAVYDEAVFISVDVNKFVVSTYTCALSAYISYLSLPVSVDSLCRVWRTILVQGLNCCTCKKSVIILNIRCGYLSCKIAIFTTTTSQEVCRISVRNDVCISQVAIILFIILPLSHRGSHIQNHVFCIKM